MKYISAEELEALVRAEISYGRIVTEFSPKQFVNSVVNSVNIVKCKDCKYFQHVDGYNNSDGDHVCERQPKYNEYGEVNMLVVYPNDFCSRGERKETE